MDSLISDRPDRMSGQKERILGRKSRVGGGQLVGAVLREHDTHHLAGLCSIKAAGEAGAEGVPMIFAKDSLGTGGTFRAGDTDNRVKDG